MIIMTELYLMLGILLMILILAFIFIKKKDRKEPDYNVYIIIGIVFLVMSLGNSSSNSLWFLGLLFMIIGLIEKVKEKNKKSKNK